MISLVCRSPCKVMLGASAAIHKVTFAVLLGLCETLQVPAMQHEVQVHTCVELL